MRRGQIRRPLLFLSSADGKWRFCEVDAGLVDGGAGVGARAGLAGEGAAAAGVGAGERAGGWGRDLGLGRAGVGPVGF